MRSFVLREAYVQDASIYVFAEFFNFSFIFYRVHFNGCKNTKLWVGWTSATLPSTGGTESNPTAAQSSTEACIR
ncbi:hypothetical protein CKA32_005053 [Geitlerinema sp. FC II]|nr:hypothetical protein CKA32_005053 [Geitlerinema sp. FC II]